ncbi:acyl carrier protein [Campylobacter hyointestinalis]|nr:acyl carrier protein [Campylobacter hyointestinalis]
MRSLKMIDEIKEMIIKDLNLEDVKPSDIDEDAPLFSDGLGLDSVDALELGLSIQKRYGIVLDPKTDNVKEIYRSVNTLANFIENSRSK